MAINVEITKNNNENTMSLIRRFTRRMQETGVVQKVKGNRYADRPLSKLGQKKAKLKYLEKRKISEKMKKLGKIAS